ncbi:hypothetical protein FACS1894211_14530 [Clostridia bacterium]|nr:hypothetical protein FACS1894211_14530 [Clostridia bacterium]
MSDDFLKNGFMSAPPHSAQQVAEQAAAQERILAELQRKYTQKDTEEARFRGEVVGGLKEQVAILQGQNDQLTKAYDQQLKANEQLTKANERLQAIHENYEKQIADSTKEARTSKRFAILSLIVGTAIALVSLIIAIVK